MKLIRPGTTVIVVATLASTLLSVPTSASGAVDGKAPRKFPRMVTYEGKTSAPKPNYFSLAVLERKNGRRNANELMAGYTLTCPDATTDKAFIDVGWWPGAKVGEGGAFSRETEPFGGGTYLKVEGVIKGKHASGTFIYTEARLNADHVTAQVCTTGEISWSVTRTGSKPVRFSGTPREQGNTHIRLTRGDGSVQRQTLPA